mmetsp:Transcript_20190/g.42016  ORF Transcript_20190/g.42016 Transcript_20190/m.42016 type:complete len:319 (-) Transcript_20190:168-1124(-)
MPTMTNSDSDAESEASVSANSSSKYNNADDDEQKSSGGSECSKVDLEEVVVPETKTDDRFETIHNPWLVDPVEKLSKRTKYSRCWKYFKFYDLTKHPNKVDVCRCMLCHKDLSAKTGGQNLFVHLSSYHFEECKLLFADQQSGAKNGGNGEGGKSKPVDLTEGDDADEDNESEASAEKSTQAAKTTPVSGPRRSARVAANISASPAAMVAPAMFASPTAFVPPVNFVAPHISVVERAMEEEAAKNAINAALIAKELAKATKQEKHWLEMWENSRVQLNRLTKEFAKEMDLDVKADLQRDIIKLMKRKGRFEDMLGMGS